MKRPEGFDPTPPGQGKPQRPRRPAKEPSSARPAMTQPTSRAATPRPTAGAPTPTSRSATGRPTTASPTTGRPARPAAPGGAPHAPDPAVRGASMRQPRPDAAAKRELRRAARARRRFERSEVRRFTRRARNRRIALAGLAATILTLVGLIVTAVYSPILALRQVTVDGTERIDAAEVREAVESQLGTPLALLDYDAITRELTPFPLIRSYVTEIVPPDTLLVHITERQPVGSIKVGDGYELVDPAGITVQQSAERIEGVPYIDLGGGDTSSAAFAAVVSVLLALPDDLLDQVVSITATTKDDVTFELDGVGQGVSWGSADDSTAKAKLLEALIDVIDEDRKGVFDVSAPSNGVFVPSD